MTPKDEFTIDDVVQRLDTLNTLMARNLYAGRKVNEVASSLHELGLSPKQIATALETSVKNVQNRLAENKKPGRATEVES